MQSITRALMRVVHSEKANCVKEWSSVLGMDGNSTSFLANDSATLTSMLLVARYVSKEMKSRSPFHRLLGSRPNWLKNRVVKASLENQDQMLLE